MGRPKINPFILDPLKETTKVDLKKVSDGEFIPQIKNYAQSVMTNSQYNLWLKSEELQGKIERKEEKVTNESNMLIMEGIKTKNKTFSIQIRKTIHNYLETKKRKTLL